MWMITSKAHTIEISYCSKAPRTENFPLSVRLLRTNVKTKEETKNTAEFHEKDVKI